MSKLREMIERKRDGFELTNLEIESFVHDLVSKSPPPDYQVAAFLAFCFCKGLSDHELVSLTMAMRNSGKQMSYEDFPKDAFFVDKHSTGGVGDKITIPLIGILRACSENIYIPMIAGRALGHTGGTVDKMESIPGFSCEITRDEFMSRLQKMRVCLTGQSSEIAPADKVLYALRDVTGTVPSIELITASILSKKLSENLSAIVFDVKFGSGAFMRDFESAVALASKLTSISRKQNVAAEALLTSMEDVLGDYCGNLLEIKESIDILKGDGPEDSTEVTMVLAKRMLILSGETESDSEKKIRTAIESGKALQNFYEIVESHGGRISEMENRLKLSKLKIKEFLSPTSGYLDWNVYDIGMALIELGASRKIKSDIVDHEVGFQMLKKRGQKIEVGEPVMKIYYHDDQRLDAATQVLNSGLRIQEEAIAKSSLIRKLMLTE